MLVSTECDIPLSTMVYTFSPRWKEELVCSCPTGRLVLELTMGILTIYFPTQKNWRRLAPSWAKNLHDEIHTALEACRLLIH